MFFVILMFTCLLLCINYHLFWELKLRLDDLFSTYIFRCWLSNIWIDKYIFYLFHICLCLWWCIHLFQDLNLGSNDPLPAHIIQCWLSDTWIEEMFIFVTCFCVWNIFLDVVSTFGFDQRCRTWHRDDLKIFLERMDFWHPILWWGMVLFKESPPSIMVARNPNWST